MKKIVKLSISGRGHDTDAPTVDDLLDQVRDNFSLFETIEKSMMDDGISAIEWRITNASKASPLSITVAAFSRQHAVNVDERTELVLKAQYAGLAKLLETSNRPDYFTDKALAIAERIFDRVTNGLDETTIDIGGGDVLTLRPTVARSGSQNIRTVLAPVGRPYKEIGSIEGRFKTVGRGLL